MLVLFTQLQDQVGRNLKLSVGEPLMITTTALAYIICFFCISMQRGKGDKAMCDFRVQISGLPL